ncbi:MAG: hypothetical protein K2G03_01080 [Bacilli bacterium]|nr:hypothetical protein [Bacilli bacterium]
MSKSNLELTAQIVSAMINGNMIPHIDDSSLICEPVKDAIDDIYEKLNLISNDNDETKNINNCKFCGTKCEYTDADFCSNCGKPLHNLCSNKDCELNCNYDEIIGLPLEAKYCYICGSKSVLFDDLAEFDCDKDDHNTDKN